MHAWLNILHSAVIPNKFLQLFSGTAYINKSLMTFNGD